MSISKWKNKAGVTYAYEIISHYDPETKQSRPKKVYLGRVNPETGEIEPTSGKRGRPRKQPEEPQVPEPAPGEEADYEKLYREAQKELKELEIQYARQQETITQLRMELAAEKDRARELDVCVRRVYEAVRKVAERPEENS